jgi:mannose-6-phosphate isomerase-like protein (cupin superfamily)
MSQTFVLCRKQAKTKQLTAEYDYLAPGGSEIRLLPGVNGGGLAHCTLPPGCVSAAVSHRSVEEIWYFVRGQGQVWRKQAEYEQVVDVRPGLSLTMPVGTHFQFRNTGHEPLTFIIATMPPWPGDQEAVRVQDYWPVTTK